MTIQVLAAPASKRRRWRASLAASAALVAGILAAVGATGGSAAQAANHPWFLPGNLVLSRSVYVGTADLIQPGVTQLPAGCVGTNCMPAVADGSYPGVWNNDSADGSFGITSPIFLDQITPDGHLVNTLRVPDGASQSNNGRGSEYAVTSFSSKSELALNLSTSGRDLTFMGYYTKPNALDVSNANTPGVIDPSNPVTGATYRLVATVNMRGQIRYTLTNAYSGNNGRAAILNDTARQPVIYTSGNAGNGGNPQPDGIIIGAGAQIMSPQNRLQRLQNPGQPTPVGSFNVTQLGYKADKIGKDTNFRGLTVYNNVIYYTKGSGGNGINTVYFLDTTGKACPNGSACRSPVRPCPPRRLRITRRCCRPRA